MECLAQGQAAVAFLLAFVWMHSGGHVAADKVEEDCGMTYIQLVKGQSLMKEANKVDWKGPHLCELTYRSLDKTDNLFLIFKKFEMMDCKMDIEVHWGEKLGKVMYNCTNKPELNKPLYVDGQYSLTMHISKVDVTEKNFDIQFEVTTNASVLLTSTAIYSQETSVLTIILATTCALITSLSLWKP